MKERNINVFHSCHLPMVITKIISKGIPSVTRGTIIKSLDSCPAIILNIKH